MTDTNEDVSRQAHAKATSKNNDHPAYVSPNDYPHDLGRRVAVEVFNKYVKSASEVEEHTPRQPDDPQAL